MLHAIDVAVSQLGVFEKTGQNDGVPADRYMRGDQFAWCAGFVLYCFDESDDPDVWDAVVGPELGKDSDYWKLRKVATMRKYLADRGLALGPNILPAPNDIVFFGDRGKSDQSINGSHVGIVENVSYEPTTKPNGGSKNIVHTIEGNLSNKVKRAKHIWPNPRIIGFARLIPTPAELLR